METTPASCLNVPRLDHARLDFFRLVILLVGYQVGMACQLSLAANLLSDSPTSQRTSTRLVATAQLPVVPEQKTAGSAVGPESRPRVIVIQPVILCNDDGSEPAAHAFPKKLVDRVYTKAALELIYLNPIHWHHGKARRGEVNLAQIIRDGKRRGIICPDKRVVTLLFASNVAGQKTPSGRGQQGGPICLVSLGPPDRAVDPWQEAFVVAHELGHCLNLRHVVDDPAVPDTPANLQGMGALTDRLAATGLHDTQRDTVLRSPLVMERLRFYGMAEARAQVIDETWEPYISGATDDMLRFSIGLAADDPLPREPQTRTRFAQQEYANKVLDFTEAEKVLLTDLVRRLRALIGPVWPAVSRLPWHFLKVDGTFCKGMAHTRGLAIFLSGRYLERMSTDKNFGLKLLLHEKLHVIQRLNRARFETLYQAYGFAPVTLANGELKRLNAAQNPDALNVTWAIQSGDALTLLITVLARDDEGTIQFREEYRTLNKQADGTCTIGDSRDKDAPFQQWHASFPFRVGHDHPNEVSAYLSGLLLEADHLNAQSRDFTAAQAHRLQQTRNAFQNILRLIGDEQQNEGQPAARQVYRQREIALGH
ncbi:MAG: hypothetical protein VX346_11795 [Planctomycetota bacterium]|nr:hypothetical protein [Planctomycetota bacterium]